MNWQNFKNALIGNTKFDRGLRKRLYGIEDFPKLPLRARLVRGGLFIVERVFYTFLIVSITWYMCTGTFPFAPSQESIVPPEMQPTVTAEQVEEVIENSTLDLEPYGERNNCVELAFIAARQLWWDGYQATVVKVDFSDGSGHMIVGIPTVDEGWKFLNPQGNVWVSPIVGGMLQDKRIVGLSYLYDFVWMPIEVEQK